MAYSRRSALGCGVALVAVMMAHAAGAQQRAFNLPSEEASKAIPEFARQAGLQIVAPAEQLKGVQTPAITGQRDARAALQTLLAGTGLSVAADDGAVITLRSDATVAAPPSTPAPPAAAAPVDNQLAELVVVGSQIRGAKVNKALPVSVVDRDLIVATGAVNGDELFRAIPQMGEVTFNSSFIPGSSNSARGDINSVNLRSLGVGNTLVLLNGRRVVTHPTSQANEQLVPVLGYNTNAIPVADVERLEVLRDGAGAIYGSDAVAGVVNTVLRTKFEGLSVDAQYGAAEGTHLSEFEFNVFGGHGFQDGRGHITGTFEYNERTQEYSRDEPFTASSDKRPLFVGTNIAGFTALDGRGTTLPYGVFRVVSPTGGTSSTTYRQGTTAVTDASSFFHVQPTLYPGCAAATGAGLCLGTGTLTTPLGGAARDLRYDTAAAGLTVIPSVHRENLYLNGDYEIAPGLVAFGEFGYYHAQTHASEAPVGTLTSSIINVPASNYYNPFGPTVFANGQVNPNRLPNLVGVPASGLPVQLYSYLFADLGPQSVDVEDFQSRFLVGLRGKTWGFNWETAGLFSEAQVKDISDNVSSNALQRQLALSTPDAYNPFNGGCQTVPDIGDCTPSSQASLNAIRLRIKRQDYTQLALVDFKVSRPDLFTLPAGPVGVALGVEVRHEVQKDGRDANLNGTVTFVDAVTGLQGATNVPGVAFAPNTEGDRTVESLYAEFEVPVISPDMHIPLVREVGLQLAGRFENYSDVGSVAKPKVAGYWDLFEGVRFRASYSQGFRAPNLEQLNATVVTRTNTRTDYIRCQADLNAGRITSFATCPTGDNYSTAARRAGNPNLDPETSDNISAGVVFEPKFVPPEFGHFTLTADLWQIKSKGLIGVFGEGNALILDYLNRNTSTDKLNPTTNPLVVRAAPTAQDIAQFAGTGLAPVGTVLYVNDQYVNLLPQTVQGLDIGVRWGLHGTRFGSFDVTVDAAHLIKFFQEPSPGIAALLAARAAGQINAGTTLVGANSLLRQNSRPTWKLSSSFTWTYKQLQVGAFTQYISDIVDTAVLDTSNLPFPVDSTTTLNLYGQYSFEKAGLASNTRIRVGVRNITDEQPPLSTAGYVGTIYQPYGRYWYVNIRKSF